MEIDVKIDTEGRIQEIHVTLEDGRTAILYVPEDISFTGALTEDFLREAALAKIGP